MFCRILFCLLVITLSSLFDPTASFEHIVMLNGDGPPWSVLPDFMEELCPNTDICSTKLGYNVTLNGPPCCRGCSCDEDCGLSNNCCFPQLDIHQSTGKEARTCVNPVTKYTEITKKQPLQSFYMIDRCRGEIECDSCGRKRVAEWGSLYPVFSKASGLVYKNQICADCFNVTDGQVWEPVLIIDMEEDVEMSLNGRHMLTSKLIDSKDIAVIFVAPTDNALDGQICFEELIDFCVHDFQYSIFNNLTDHELCESDLRAPVWYNGHYYANVFCVICRLNTFRIPCALGPSMTAIDFEAEFDKNNSLHQTMSKNPEACTPDGKECKEVLCSVGRHLYNDECVQVHTKWKYRHFHTILAFIPKSKSDQLSINKIEDLVASVTLPNQTEWKLSEIVMEKDETDLMSHVYAELVWRADDNDHVTPADILQSTKSLVQQFSSSITYAGRVYQYKADFSRHAYLVKEKLGSIAYYKPLWLALKQKGNMTDEAGAYDKQTSMVSIFDDDNIQTIGKSISISKLFFCPQIELANSEFKAFYNGTQLYYKKTGKYFLDGEFALNKRTDGSVIARICLEDSGYHLSANKAYRTGTCTYLQFMMFFICLMGYCIRKYPREQ